MKFNLLILLLFSAYSCASQIPESNSTNSNGNAVNFIVPSTTILNNSNQNGWSDTTVYLNDNSIEKKDKDKTEKKVGTRSLTEVKNSEQLLEKSINQKVVITTEFSKTKSISTNQKTQRSPTPQMQQTLDSKVDELEVIAPTSFEYNLFNYSAGNYDVSREESLKIAELQQPGSIEVLKLSAANALVKGDTLNAKEYLNQLEFRHVIQVETIDYTSDVIQSAAGNSTLITHGFNDSYGVYQNQLNNNRDQNLSVISLDFMQSQSYRAILSTKGYDIPNQNDVNVAYLKSFCELNADKNIAISMTLPKEYLIPIQSKLYPSGLVFEYRESSTISNNERLEDLWNNQLNKKVITTYKSSLSNAYAGNYLPMLIYLRTYYEQQNELNNQQRIGKDIQQVELKSGKSTSLKKRN